MTPSSPVGTLCVWHLHISDPLISFAFRAVNHFFSFQVRKKVSVLCFAAQNFWSIGTYLTIGHNFWNEEDSYFFYWKHLIDKLWNIWCPIRFSITIIQSQLFICYMLNNLRLVCKKSIPYLIDIIKYEMIWVYYYPTWLRHCVLVVYNCGQLLFTIIE